MTDALVRLSLRTQIPFSALVAEDEAVLATYARAVEDQDKEEERRRG